MNPFGNSVVNSIVNSFVNSIVNPFVNSIVNPFDNSIAILIDNSFVNFIVYSFVNSIVNSLLNANSKIPAPQPPYQPSGWSYRYFVAGYWSVPGRDRVHPVVKGTTRVLSYPPTPLGSTGCESASGSPLCHPALGFRWCCGPQSFSALPAHPQ